MHVRVSVPAWHSAKRQNVADSDDAPQQISPMASVVGESRESNDPSSTVRVHKTGHMGGGAARKFLDKLWTASHSSSAIATTAIFAMHWYIGVNLCQGSPQSEKAAVAPRRSTAIFPCDVIILQLPLESGNFRMLKYEALPHASWASSRVWRKGSEHMERLCVRRERILHQGQERLLSV